MTTHSAPLAQAAAALRSGESSLKEYLETRYERIDEVEDDVSAWVDGPKPRAQLEAEIAALERRYPDPADRPPLYGIPIGVKDIFHVEGLPTAAGSTLPPGKLVGEQAEIVTTLREAGAVVLGKTVTTEFAHFQPGPTRNPHNLQHTPGGSSSGSAAAVATGMCPLALGTQTVGSVIRPATFCGIVGFKPSFDRISTGGVIPLSRSVDHVGLFTQEIAGMELAASVCVEGWDTQSVAERPTLGVPNDSYLDQATEVGTASFESSIESLRSAGYDVHRVEAFDDIQAINELHSRLVASDAAFEHDEWFDRYGDRYGEKTAELLTEGRTVPTKEIAAGKRGRIELRDDLEARMDDYGVDIWISPGAPGRPPEGIETTGDPIMNLPWTYAGVPTVSVPTERVDGLPMGIQCTGRFGDDERLLAWCETIESVFN